MLANSQAGACNAGDGLPARLTSHATSSHLGVFAILWLDFGHGG